MKFKFRPVAWMTGLLTLALALLAVNDQAHLIPDEWVKWLAALAALLTILLGGKVQSIVTPLAAPRSTDGRPLVPSPPAKAPSGTPVMELRADVDPRDL